MEIKITLPDGSIRELLQGTIISEAAGAISTMLKKNAIAGKIDGKSVDLNQPIEHDSHLEIVTIDSKDGLEIHRHSTAHVMAQAIKRIYGQKTVKLGIGPVIEGLG
ncbi:TGS domain-containing protein [Paenibacillus anaericanus]|uniref:TGS domain-containing protein n=1 Tax=Paenibacillus anaericanus TaxID=170367 RepID=A0A3S1E5H9_9BACL|nr:TGS domain-containing protein [Paenibacillus anaericanus]